MQFTGLYDCNGKEIYEDDIVEIKNHPFDRFIGINGMYTVGYSDHGWKYAVVAGYCITHYLMSP
ncbi:YopX family protein [Paenibacillus larvae]|nr:YopX family protein [Paenibacillus larvae]